MQDLSQRPLVFDLDGTLIDSSRDIAAACNHALESIGREPLSVDTIAGFVGSGARALLQGVLGDARAEVNLEGLLLTFQDFYAAHPVHHNRLMPGAEVCLGLRSKTRKIALCTNKPKRLTDAVVAALGWQDAFDAVVAPERGDKTKPDPELLLRVATSLGVPPETLIMVGDGPQDVGAGKAVGACTVGIRGGFLPIERLLAAEPDVLLDSLEQLPAYLGLRTLDGAAEPVSASRP